MPRGQGGGRGHLRPAAGWVSEAMPGTTTRSATPGAGVMPAATTQGSVTGPSGPENGKGVPRGAGKRGFPRQQGFNPVGDHRDGVGQGWLRLPYSENYRNNKR